MKKTAKLKTSGPLVLLILDGWGVGPATRGNAITLAKTPNYKQLVKKYPFTLLGAAGRSVGLPTSQVGNSEAGHLNLGAGRIVLQDSTRIDRSINDGTFFKNSAFQEAIRHVKKHKSNLHLMGLLGDEQTPHSDPDHLLALLTLARLSKVKPVLLHLFTDGRDSPRFMAIELLKKLKRTFLNGEKVETIMGRFYAMDRKKDWSRIEMAYEAMVSGEGIKASSSNRAILQAYNRGETDEYIKPTVIVKDGKVVGRIKDNDAIIFFNLRSDRARQLTKPFVQPDFNQKNPGAFKRKKILKNIAFIAMTDFGPDLPGILTAYPSVDLKDTLPMILHDKRQLYIAETEKYAHVTYFFNGGYADPIAGEARELIPSPNVDNYAETPAMSIEKITARIIKYLKKDQYDFITINFCNPDMIGHTGVLKAGIKTVEIVDRHLGMIVKEVLAKNGTMIVTADHGNIEEMINLKTGEIDNMHSTNPVPFILVKEGLGRLRLKKNGVLADVAPLIIRLFGLEIPKEMRKEILCPV